MQKQMKDILYLSAVVGLVVLTQAPSNAASTIPSEPVTIALPTPTLDTLHSANPTDYPRESVYTYNNGTSTDYDVILQNKESTDYKNIQLKNDKIGTNALTLSEKSVVVPSGYTWTNDIYAGSNVNFDNDTNPTTISGAIRLRIKHNDEVSSDWNRYSTYTYNVPAGYQVVREQLDNVAADGSNVQNKVFTNISTTANNSPVYNLNRDLSSVNIVADFVGNTAINSGSAIQNSADGNDKISKINSITGTFIGNSTDTEGGAINNIASNGGTSYIGYISGDFIGNSAKQGGAINNYVLSTTTGSVEINSISANFIGNKTSKWGAGICNSGKIGTIIGDFINNTAIRAIDDTKGDGVNGAGIDNTGYIDYIYGDFISNTVDNDGGAIQNHGGKIKSIKGNFVGNRAGRYGGAIHNYDYAEHENFGNIELIESDFINNTADVSGGAIYNEDTINTIKGDFSTNTAKISGGAIWNKKTIENIEGNFNFNTATENSGGAIYNNGKISTINGIFNNNQSKTNGGAIYNNADHTIDENRTIENINANFYNNTANDRGGAVYNNSTSLIKNINGTFEGNTAKFGAAIFNSGTIENIGTLTEKAIFRTNNSSVSNGNGSAIYNDTKGNITNVVADYIGNKIYNDGTIYNKGAIGYIKGDFKYNTSVRTNSGIRNEASGVINKINANFIGNMSGIGTSSEASGSNYCTILSNAGTIKELTANFIGNLAKKDSEAGFWVDSTGTASIFADTQDVIFYGNKVAITYKKDSSNNVIGYTNTSSTKYSDIKNNGGTISINAGADKIFFVGGKVIGANGIINFNKGKYNEDDNTFDTSTNYTGGKYVFNSTVEGNTINLNNGAYIKLGAVQQIIDSKRNANLEFDNLDWVSQIFDRDGNAIGEFAPQNNSDTTYGLLNLVGLTTDALEGSILDTKNNHFEENTLGSVKLNSDLGLKIDLDVKDTNSKADTFKITNTNSIVGKMILDTTGFTDYAKGLSNNKTAKIQILKSSDDKIQLTWAGAKDISEALTDVIAVMDSSMTIGGDYYLDTTTTTHDSVIFRADKDVFTNWAKLNTTEDKQYTFLDNTTYTLNEDIYFAGNNITVIGSDGVFDSNNKELFNVGTGQNVTFKDIKIENAKDVTNNNKLTFENATIDSKITNNSGSELTIRANNGKTLSFNKDIVGTDYNLNLTSNNSGTIELNNKITANNAKLEQVTLKLGNSDTLKNAELNAISGTIDVKDGAYTNYNIGKLTSSDVVRYNIDMALSKDVQKSDTFTVGDGSSGTVYLSSINVTNNLDDEEEHVIQIIKSASATAPQLKYDSSKILTDTVGAAIMSSDELIVKDFGLYTTNTTNDSIKIRGAKDTFKAWREFVTTDHKQFTFVEGSNKTIDSGIDFDGNNNAEIINNGTLVNDGKLKNITFTNNNVLTNNGTLEGTVQNTKTLTNNGTLQGVIKNKNGATLTSNAANLVATDNIVYNDGTLDLTGSTNNNSIVESSEGGNSKVVFSTPLTNNGVITQDNVEISTDGKITNNAKITALINNEGELTSSADNLSGTITNNNVLNLEGGVNNNVITMTNSSGVVKFNNVTSNTKSVNAKTITNNTTGETILVNTGDIQVKKFINSGKMTNNATIAISENFENNSILTNNSTVNGNLKNSETLNNNGTINGDFDNKTGARAYTKRTDLNGTVNNDGDLYYTDNGTTTYDITGNGTLHLAGNGVTTLNHGLDNNVLSLDNGILRFGAITSLNSFVVANNSNVKTIDLVNNSIETTNLGNVILNGTANLDIDFNLSDLTSDRIEASSYSGTGKLNISKINLSGVPTSNNIKVFLGDTTGIEDEYLTATNQELPDYDTPIGKLKGRVQDRFLCYAASNNGISDFNPAIMATGVASLGGFLTQAQTLQDAFYHMDNYSKYTQKQRIAAENKNKSALAEGEILPAYVDKNVGLPETNRAMWTKPYTSFEQVHLNSGLNVRNVGYGFLYGGDSDLYTLKNGFKGVVSAFVGFNGSRQSYRLVDINQQGATVGLTGSLYKGNFFTALALSTGASLGEAHTQYGIDNFGMLTAGIANRTGYNIEIADGKFIIQPQVYTGYVFVNTFDHTNAAGVHIQSDPLHSIQVAPGITLIGNFKNGWQPYARADVMMTFMDKTKIMANDTRLPALSVKPYVQYGVGVQKTWDDKFTAFFHTLFRNGGRSGVVFQAGFRWALGTNSKQNKTPVSKKRILKSL